MRAVLQFTTILFALMFLVSCQKDAPDLVLLNGRIWTAEDRQTFVEAVAVRGNLIMQTGSTEDIRGLVGSSTKVIDLQGKLVIPGFNDAHIHFLGGSLELFEVDLTGAMNGAEIVSAVARFATEHPEKTWITGRGWQYTWFPSGMPSAEVLAEMITDRPVFIKAYDGHSAWANAKALELAGVTAKSKPAGFGEVVLDARGNLTGALLEDAMDLVARIIPKPSREEKLAALRAGLKLANSLGITSIQNASGNVDELSLYVELQQKNELSLRYAAALSVEASTPENEIAAYRVKRKELAENPRIRADAIKFMLDGVIESHTAAMLKPYHDVPLAGDFAIPLAEYKRLVSALDKDGFRLQTHAIGDRAVREALNAYESAEKENGPRPRRNRVEHIETISPEDIPRFASLGVMPSMEPIHADPGTMGVWQKAIGPERMPWSFAWKSMLDAGAKLVYSSDWPACIDINPIRGIHVAVNRRTPDGFPVDAWVAEQKIDITDALIAYTRTGAYATFEEDTKGQIKAGMLADMVVLSNDLFTIDPMSIASTHVVMTVFDGTVIYEKEKAGN